MHQHFLLIPPLSWHRKMNIFPTIDCPIQASLPLSSLCILLWSLLLPNALFCSFQGCWWRSVVVRGGSVVFPLANFSFALLSQVGSRVKEKRQQKKSLKAMGAWRELVCLCISERLLSGTRFGWSECRAVWCVLMRVLSHTNLQHFMWLFLNRLLKRTWIKRLLHIHLFPGCVYLPFLTKIKLIVLFLQL